VVHHGAAIQGRADGDQWVTLFTIQFSSDFIT
jgi:hypothetical protein